MCLYVCMRVYSQYICIHFTVVIIIILGLITTLLHAEVSANTVQKKNKIKNDKATQMSRIKLTTSATSNSRSAQKLFLTVKS